MLSLDSRGQLIIDVNRTNAKLQVKDVVTSDEGEYKCEITFLDITKNCRVNHSPDKVKNVSKSRSYYLSFFGALQDAVTLLAINLTRDNQLSQILN